MTRLQHFFHDWSESFKTYYLSYLVALFATVLWIMVIYHNNYSYDMELNIFYELLATCAIAFPLFLLWPLYNQTRNKSDYKIVIVSSLIGTLLSLLFAWYVSHHNIFGPDQTEIQSHIIVVLLSYLIAWGSILATVAYAHPRDNLTTRWRWKELFVHIVIAWLGSAILRGGIAASLGSIDYLFEVDIDDKWYAYVGVVSFLIIGVSIFLTNLHRTKYEENYHSFFRFFGLYIFFPLAIVYACILLVYGGKIVITQTWPKGLISMMVIGYTIWGLIAYLLTYPLKESSLVHKMRSTYFISILVFVFLLFGAIGIRISQYGITESRYLIVMVGLWIATVGVTSLIRPKKTFSTMIFTLLWLAISSAYLPRGSGPIALSSQKNRLELLLEKNGFWDGNKLIVQEKNVENMSESEQKELAQVSDIIEYISRWYGPTALNYLYTSTTGFTELLEETDYWTHWGMFMEKLGIIGELPDVYYRDLYGEEREEYFSVYKNQPKVEIVSVEDYKYSITLYPYGRDRKEITQEEESMISEQVTGDFAAASTQTEPTAVATVVQEIEEYVDQGIRIRTERENQSLITITPDKGKAIIIDLEALAPKLYQASKLQNSQNEYRLDFDGYSVIFDNVSWRKTWDIYTIDMWYQLTVLIK